MKFKTFVISLKNDNDDRRKNVRKQMHQYKWDFEFQDAVDGDTINKLEDSRIHRDAHWMRHGQIGCALSHMECYQRVVDENLDYALIFEDDFKFKSDLSELLEITLNSLVCKISQVLFLYVNTFPEEKLSLRRVEGNLFSIKGGRPLCATAYIITRRFCQKMINQARPIISVADDWSRFLDMDLISDCFVMYPLPIGIMEFDSQIGYKPYGRKQRIGRYLSSRIKLPSVIKGILNNETSLSSKIEILD